MPKNDKLTNVARKGSGLPERTIAGAEPVDPIASRVLDIVLEDPAVSAELRKRASERLGRDIGSPPAEDDTEAYEALTTETTKLLKRARNLNNVGGKTLHRAVPSDKPARSDDA